MLIVSIHQPLYLPWQPYFAKIACSDIFIFLDDVQYPMGKSFFNRNIIKGANGPIVLTAPVTGKGDRLLIKDIRIDSSSKWQATHWKSISQCYSKAPYFSLYSNVFEEIYMNYKWEYLSDFCETFICKIAELLKFNTKFLWASKLSFGNNSGTERLIDLVLQSGATKYLTGDGAGSLRYMDANKYLQSGIQVFWHSYVQTPYRQRWKEFLPNTCILDLIFNCGSNSKEVLINSSDVHPS